MEIQKIKVGDKIVYKSFFISCVGTVKNVYPNKRQVLLTNGQLILPFEVLGFAPSKDKAPLVK